mgnify:CR=1 FL=1
MKKKKIAICLYGISRNVDLRGIAIDWRSSFFLSEKIFNNPNAAAQIDFFIHTWSAQEKDDLIRSFSPKKISVEKSIFPNYELPPFAHNLDYQNSNGYNIWQKIQALYSRWDSEGKSLVMKQEYEKEQNFKYDFVLSCRFDLVFHSFFPFDVLERDKLYISNWHLFREDRGKWFAYPDAWFLSGTEIMDKHAKLFHHLDEYLNPSGDYYKYITQNLGRPAHEYISSHGLVRWHAINSGYVDKERMIGLEYETWNLFRKSHIRKNPHWSPTHDINKPMDLTK